MALRNAPTMTTLPVTDLAKAKQFYGKTLGLVQEKTPGKNEALFRAGNNSNVFVYWREKPTSSDATAFSFQVANVDREVTALRKKGISFEEYDMPGLKTVNGIADLDGMKAAWFKDPFGNIIALGQAPPIQTRPRANGRKAPARKPNRKTGARKPARKTTARKPARKTTARKPARKTTARKAAPRRKTPSRKRR